MGDYTALTLQIVRVDGDATPVADIINEYGIIDEFDEKDPSEGVIGVWHDYESRVGTIFEVAERLIEAKASFRMWQEPKYEYSGWLIMHTPELGRFDSECDADGTPTFTPEDARRMMTMERDEFERYIGAPWEAALAGT